MLCFSITASVSGFKEATSTDSLKWVSIPSTTYDENGRYLRFVGKSSKNYHAGRAAAQKSPQQGSAFVQQA